MPSGGSRSGKAGKAYSNRSDLNAKPRLPVTTVPGQPYGDAKAQADAQKAVPMGTPPLPDMPDLTDHPGLLPGELPPLTDPTARPGEPVTHGLPMGPGGGPEVFPQAPSPVLKGLAILNSLGDNTSPAIKQLRMALNVQQANGVNE